MAQNDAIWRISGCFWTTPVMLLHSLLAIPPYNLPYINSSPTIETAFASSLPPSSSTPFHHITQSLTGPLLPTLIPTLLPFSLPIIFPLSHFQLILRNHAGHIHTSLTSHPKTPATVLPQHILLYTIPLQIPYRSLSIPCQ